MVVDVQKTIESLDINMSEFAMFEKENIHKLKQEIKNKLDEHRKIGLSRFGRTAECKNEGFTYR